MKKRFTTEPILVTSDLDRKMRMEMDVLDYAIEEVLSIECSDGWWGSVAYLSKSLNKTERNYKIHDKKTLVIIRGFQNWRYLLNLSLRSGQIIKT